jgi:prepilin-type N-terminal cleavage/methylation domain
MKDKHWVKGFTLIELLVVMAIIAALSTILVPMIFGYVEKANNAADLSNIHNMINAVNEAFMFNEDEGFYETCWHSEDNENLGYIYVDDDEIRVSNKSIAKLLEKMGYITDAEHPDRMRSGIEPCYNFRSKSKIRCQSSIKWCRYQIEFHRVASSDCLKWGITCATSSSSTHTAHEDAYDKVATDEMAERVGVDPYYKNLGGLD